MTIDDAIAIVVVLALIVVGATMLLRQTTPAQHAGVDVSVTILLDEKPITSNAWTYTSLDEENVTRIAPTYLNAAMYETGLRRDPGPKGQDVLTRLVWPQKGWRLSRGVLDEEGQQATLVVTLKRQTAKNW